MLSGSSSTMTRNLLFYIALQFAPVVILGEYVAPSPRKFKIVSTRIGNFDSPVRGTCVEFELADLENYISNVKHVEVPTVDAMAAGFKCPVNALPFGALKSDWSRLLRLHDAQPAGSVLKEKLPRLYGLLVLAYQTMQETFPVFAEERSRYTNKSLDTTDNTYNTYETQPGTSALLESTTVSVISDLTQDEHNLEPNNESKGTTLDLGERSWRNTRNTDDYSIFENSHSQESTEKSVEGSKETGEILRKYQTSSTTMDFNNDLSPSVLITKLKATDAASNTERIRDDMKYLSSTTTIDTDTRKNVTVEYVQDISKVSFTGKSNALDNVDGKAIATTKWIEEITMTRKTGYLSTVDNKDKEENLTNTTISGNNIINETNILVLARPDNREDVNDGIKATTESTASRESIKQNNYFDTDYLTGSVGTTLAKDLAIKYSGTTVTAPVDDIKSVTLNSNYMKDKDPSGGSSRYYTSLLPASRIYLTTGSAQEETSRTTEGIPKDNRSRFTSGEDYYSEFDSKYSPASSSSDELDVSGIKTVTDVFLDDPYTSGESTTVPKDTELTTTESGMYTLKELITGTVPGVITSRGSNGESVSEDTSPEVSFKEEVTSPRWSTYESTDLSYSRMKTVLSVGSQGAETGSSITGSFFRPGTEGTSPGLTGSDSVSSTSSISPNEALDQSDGSTTSVPGVDEKVSEMDSNGIEYFTDNTGSTMSSFDFADKELPLPTEGIQVVDVSRQTNESLETKSESTTSESFKDLKYVTSENSPTTEVTSKEPEVTLKLNTRHPEIFYTLKPLGHNVTVKVQQSKRNKHVLPYVLKKAPWRNIPGYQVTPASILTYNVKHPVSSSGLVENGEEVVFVLGKSHGIRVPLLTGKRSESNADIEKLYRWFHKEGGKLDENERRIQQDVPERAIRVECRNEE